MLWAREQQIAIGRRSRLASVYNLLASVCVSDSLRRAIVRLACRSENGQMWSTTFRELLLKHYGVSVGRHSYGPCLWPGNLPRGTRIGSYCSLAAGIQILRRNHPINWISQHPFFFNSTLGLVRPGLVYDISDRPLTIGNDVWIGQNAIIAPGCQTIGDGAIVAAGAVVTGNVETFSVVGGVPARLIKWRFDEPTRIAVSASKWWDLPVWRLAEVQPFFTRPISAEDAEVLRRLVHQNASRTSAN